MTRESKGKHTSKPKFIGLVLHKLLWRNDFEVNMGYMYTPVVPVSLVHVVTSGCIQNLYYFSVS